LAHLCELLLCRLECLLEGGELRLCGLSGLGDLRELALGIGSPRLNIGQGSCRAPLLVKLPAQGRLRLLHASSFSPGGLQTTGV
jgi:hypothetical protein